jgi:hypothetical protein
LICGSPAGYDTNVGDKPASFQYELAVATCSGSVKYRAGCVEMRIGVCARDSKAVARPATATAPQMNRPHHARINPDDVSFFIRVSMFGGRAHRSLRADEVFSLRVEHSPHVDEVMVLEVNRSWTSR